MKQVRVQVRHHRLFKKVHHVHPHRLAQGELNRVVGVLEGAPVPGVEVGLAVAVEVESAHHHHQLAHGRAARLGIDDHQPVQAVVDVLGSRHGVAVVGHDAEGARDELVGVSPARRHQLKHAVGGSGVDAVEMNRVRQAPFVHQRHSQQLALGHAQNRAGHGAVEGPGRDGYAGRHLVRDIFLDDERVLPHAVGSGAGRRGRGVVDLSGVEAPLVGITVLIAPAAQRGRQVARVAGRDRLGRRARRLLSRRGALPRQQHHQGQSHHQQRQHECHQPSRTIHCLSPPPADARVHSILIYVNTDY